MMDPPKEHKMAQLPGDRKIRSDPRDLMKPK